MEALIFTRNLNGISDPQSSVLYPKQMLYIIVHSDLDDTALKIYYSSNKYKINN